MKSGIEENSDEMVIILAVHDSSVKLPKVDEWVKTLDGVGWPCRMKTIREKDGPKGSRLPNGKDDDSASGSRDGDFLPPRGYELANWRTDVKAFAWPTDRECISGQRAWIDKTRIETLAARVRG